MTKTWSRRDMIGGAAAGLTASTIAAAGPALAQSPPPAPQPPVGYTRLDPAFDALVYPDAPFEPLFEGLRLAEGPVWVGGPDGYLLMSDVPGNIIHRWSARDGHSSWLEPSGYGGPPTQMVTQYGSNGLILARGGLVMGDTGNRGVALVDLRTKRKRMLATHFEGKRLNSPNDMVLARDGSIYFTDPVNGLRGTNNSPYRELDFTAVFRLKPNGELSVVDRDLFNPNGIALSPDGRTLYVTEYSLGWKAYDLDAQGEASNRRWFVESATTGISGADGMKVDADGNIWTSSNLGISVFNPAGQRLGIINVGAGRHSNCAFGADGYLYVAYGGKAARVKVKARGLSFGG